MVRTTTKTKLMLFVDEQVERKARALSRRRKTSISAMFSEFIEREGKAGKELFDGVLGSLGRP